LRDAVVRCATAAHGQPVPAQALHEVPNPIIVIARKWNSSRSQLNNGISAYVYLPPTISTGVQRDHYRQQRGERKRRHVRATSGSAMNAGATSMNHVPRSFGARPDHRSTSMVKAAGPRDGGRFLRLHVGKCSHPPRRQPVTASQSTTTHAAIIGACNLNIPSFRATPSCSCASNS
jgi:hypothetical protein